MSTIFRSLAFALFLLSFTSVLGASFKELDLDEDQQPRQFPCPDAAEIFPCECSPVNGRLYMDCSSAVSNNQLNTIFSTADFIATDFYEFSMDGNTALSTLDFSFSDVYFEKIILESCSFTEISTEFFSTSSSALTTVSLYDNSQLAAFPFSSLQLTQNVTTVVIDGSKISYVPPIISPKLRNFEISNSPVSSILPGTFSQVTTLANINFAADDISTLRTNSIPISSDSMVLDFSFNSITNIEDKSFYQSTSGGTILTLLDLSNNQLSSLGMDTIPITPGTGNIIKLENNTIDTLDDNTFYTFNGELTGTQNLDIHLENNNLKEFKQATFQSLMSSIQYIWAKGNPLECACDIAWIVTNEEYAMKISSDTTCADGVYVKDLDPIFYVDYC